MKKKFKIIILLFITVIFAFHFWDLSSTVNAQSTDCNILPAIVNVTHDTIGSTSIFSSKKYGLFYNGYKTDEYAPVITKNESIEMLWFVSTRAFDIPQTYRFFWDYFPLGWIFGNSPKEEIIKPVKYQKYNYLSTDKYHFWDVFYSTRYNPNDTLKPWQGWSKPKILVIGNPVFDKYIRGPLTSHNGSYFIIAADRSFDTNGLSKNWDLYEFSKTATEYTKPTPIDSVNTDSSWESQPALSLDGNTLFFTRKRPDSKDTIFHYNIWFSKRIHGKWSKPEPLNSINTEYNETFPHCGKDGKFYFSSNKPGGKGGFDIYIAEFDENGIPQNPKNYNDFSISRSGFIYPKINAEADEISPSISLDSKYIYFSSNRSVGFGGYDIYACEIKIDTTPRPPAIINLIVNVLLRDTCIDKEGNDYVPIKPLDKNDINTKITLKSGSGTTIHTLNDTIKLEPNTTYELNINNPNLICKETITFTTHVEDETIERTITCDVDVEKLDKIIISDYSGIPYFITGYWKPLTTDNWKDYQKNRAKIITAGFIDDSDYHYYKVPECIDIVFDKFIYTGINKIVNQLLLKKIVCVDDDFVLKITVDGYTDDCNLSSGEYTGSDVEVNDVVIPNGQPIHARILRKKDGSIYYLKDGGQGGNVILSMLRVYWTKETIHNNLLKVSSFYKKAVNNNLIQFIINGNGVYNKSVAAPPTIESECAKDLPKKSLNNQPCNKPLSRRIEISFDVVPRCLMPEIQQDVKRVYTYFINLNFDNRDDAETANYLLEKYAADVFTQNGKLNLIYDEIEENKFRLITNKLADYNDALKIQRTAREVISKYFKVYSIDNIILDSLANPFVVSFGVYKEIKYAKQQLKKLSEILGNNIKLKEINQNGLAYSIRSEKYRNKEIAEFKKNEFRNKLMTDKISVSLEIIELGEVTKEINEIKKSSDELNVEIVDYKLGDTSQLPKGKIIFGINPDLENPTDLGLKIGRVITNSPAEKAGLKKGDIIVEANSKSIKDIKELKKLLRICKPDNILNVKYIRESNEYNVQVKLEVKEIPKKDIKI